MRRGPALRAKRAALVAVCAWVSLAGAVHAQPPPGDEFGPPPAPPEPAQPAPAGDAAPEPDPEPSVSIALAIALGVATEERFDDVLAGLGYERSQSFVGGDGAVMVPLTPWLWLGGRTQLRARDWGREGQPSVSAMGVGLLVAVEARLQVGRTVAFGFGAGGGGGIVSVRMVESTDSPFAPAAYGGVRLLTRVGTGAHFFGRFEYGYFEATDLNGSGLDVNLGGVTFGFGMEVRR